MVSRLFCLLALSVALTAHSLPLVSWERQTWLTENGLPQNTVHALLQSSDGYIWMATEGGLARFDGIRFQVYSIENFPALPSNDIRALAEAATGEVWAATAGGVARVRGAEVQAFTTHDGLPGNNVLSVFRTAAGDLIALTSAGAARWNGRNFIPDTSTDGHTPAPAERVSFPPNDPLSMAGILCQMRDREGNLWIGTESRGVTVLRLPKFSVFGVRQGLSGESVRCVFERRDGSLWIGTNENGVTRFKEGQFSNLGVREGLSSNVVIALGENPEGDLLVGTPDGLNVVHGKTVSVLTSADGLADDFVRSISIDSHHALYIGTRRGLTVLKNGQTRTYTQKDGLGSDLIGAVLPDSNGDVWVATLRGLARLENGTIRNYTTRDGLSSDVITSLHRDIDGVLWIGTQGGGLNCYRAGRFFSFPKATGLPKIVYGVAEDGSGNLWIPSNTGIYRVPRQDLFRGTADTVAYGTGDGLRVNECSGGGHPAVWKTRDRTIWFATPRGVAAMTEAQAQLNRVPPPVVVESISIDDGPVELRPELSIAPGHGRYAFEYAGLSFVSPQKVRYRYMLQGFDRDWIDAGSRRVAYYTNLPHGNYTFRVMARNNDGVWSTRPASVRLHLEPHFYQTVWFVLVCIFALLVAAYTVYRLRVRQVAARYDAVLAERNRIAREIHDTLAQGFTGISVQLEIVARLMSTSAEAALEHLNEARTLVRESLAEARRSIWELRSQSVAAEDLPARLTKLTRSSVSTGEPRITLDIQGAFRPLSPTVEDELLRITQEAVRNAIRHAHATHVAITLSFGPAVVRLTVSDNGLGFEAQSNRGTAEGHFGIAGMRERAAAIGATIEVVSATDTGTTVSLEVPV